VQLKLSLIEHGDDLVQTGLRRGVVLDECARPRSDIARLHSSREGVASSVNSTLGSRIDLQLLCRSLSTQVHNLVATIARGRADFGRIENDAETRRLKAIEAHQRAAGIRGAQQHGRLPGKSDSVETDGSGGTQARATAGGTYDGTPPSDNSGAPASLLQRNAQHQRAAGTRGAYQHGGLPGKTNGVETDGSGVTQTRATVAGTYDGAPPSDNSRAPASLPQIRPTGTRGVDQHGELPGTPDDGESDDGVGIATVDGTLDGASPSDGRLAPVSFPQINKQSLRADVDSRGIGQHDGVRGNPAGGEEEVDGVDAEEINTHTPSRISPASERQQIRRDNATENSRIAILPANVHADEIRSNNGTPSRSSSRGARTATNNRQTRQLRQLQQVEMEMALLEDAAKDSNEDARDERDFDDGEEEAERVSTTSDAISSDQDNDAGENHNGYMGLGGLTYSTGRTRYANVRGHIKPSPARRATAQIARGSTVDRPREMWQEGACNLNPLPKRQSLPTFKTRKRRVVQALQQKPRLSDILSEAHPDDTDIASLLLRMCVLSGSTIAGYEEVYDALVPSNGDTIDAKQLFRGLQSVCKHALKSAERDFVVEVLDLLQSDGPFQSKTATFEEFAMAAALSGCVVNLSPNDRNLITCINLKQPWRKAILMFFIDANEDCTLSLEDLGVLMHAGRVDERQIQGVLDHLAQYGDSITLLQYLAHLPLFLDVHHEIVENTLDSTRRLV
jgi:hypothetical protein